MNKPGMENLYSDLEGLRLAMEIEKRGRAFYDQALLHTRNSEHKELFMFLRDEETQHYERFRDIYEVVKQRREAVQDDYIFDPEISRYITVLAESHVFPREDEAAAAIAELNAVPKILKTAAQAEKDSILLYAELAKNARFADARQIFSVLVEEEKKHLVKLREILRGWA